MTNAPVSDILKQETLPERLEDRVGWAYKVANETDRARARFDAWAADYDRDVENLLGWRGPQAMVDFVVKYISPDAEILDAGSGTGLMGALLRDKGFHNLVGTDISEKMLEIARDKDVYTQDFQADLTSRLPVADQMFDCVVAAGVSGYMIDVTLKEFVRILRPGGHIIYTISDDHFDKQGFSDIVAALCADKSLEVVEKSDEFAALPKSDPEHLARVHVYRTNAA